jgi:hypothetical protein
VPAVEKKNAFRFDLLQIFSTLNTRDNTHFFRLGEKHALSLLLHPLALGILKIWKLSTLILCFYKVLCFFCLHKFSVVHMYTLIAEHLRQSVIFAASDAPRCVAAIQYALTRGPYRSAQSRVHHPMVPCFT